MCFVNSCHFHLPLLLLLLLQMNEWQHLKQLCCGPQIFDSSVKLILILMSWNFRKWKRIVA